MFKEAKVISLVESEKTKLVDVLQEVKSNPYLSYREFHSEIKALVIEGKVPAWFNDIAKMMSDDTTNNVYVHYLNNCPIDDTELVLDIDDPRTDKINRKKTFIAESFLELFSQLRSTPVFAYETRNHGDFFQDVYQWSKFRHTNTVRSDKEISWHNDRTAHPIRAGYLYLLGMYVPPNSNAITNYIHGSDIVKCLDSTVAEALREKYFCTDFDPISKQFNSDHDISEKHAILETEDNSVRFYEGNTKVIDGAPLFTRDALKSFNEALYKAKRSSVKIETAGLLSIPNKLGLHNREILHENEENSLRQRWLLKTYNFGSVDEYNRYSNLFKDNTKGLIQEVFSAPGF